MASPSGGCAVSGIAGCGWVGRFLTLIDFAMDSSSDWIDLRCSGVEPKMSTWVSALPQSTAIAAANAQQFCWGQMQSRGGGVGVRGHSSRT
jgi:hypothetical protein